MTSQIITAFMFLHIVQIKNKIQDNCSMAIFKYWNCKKLAIVFSNTAYYN